MSPFKKILCPVDLSDVSPKIAPYVVSMAEKYDAEVFLLFIARLFKYYANIYVPAVSISSFEDALCQGAQKGLDEFAEEFFRDVPKLFKEVVAGYPGQEIVKYAEKNEMDLIIIGTHGRKGLDSILFGSVAEYVVKNSSVPVMSVNPFREKTVKE